MRRPIFFSLFLGAIATVMTLTPPTLKPAYAADNAAPVVLELFTSQSCSSCPSADRVLAELVKQPNVIALSCNVTYWNHLSWKDTLSLEACTERQRAYSAAAGRRGVFTPEMLINGSASLVGSDASGIRRAMAAATGGVLPIAIARDAAGGVTVALPTISTSGATVTLMPFKAAVTQAVPSGENSGKTLHYTNAVMQITTLEPRWNGVAKSVTLPPAQLPATADGLTVLLQEGSASGKIIAAGQIVLR